MFFKPWVLVGAVLVGSLLGGCGSSAGVASTLPVRKVILYRSGVGYFERAGKHSGGDLGFVVKRSEVGDFLGSLTVIDRAKGSVRSVSFEAPEVKPVPVPPPYYIRPPQEPPPPAPAPEDERVKVHVNLGEGAHDLTVAYVVGTPVWKASYRLVLEKETALLQAWAVVQNLSGDDWRDVQLALTTGAPIAFRSDLGTPVIPERPLVTDSGEVISAVPQSETALEQQAAPPPPAMAKDEEAVPEAEAEAASPEALQQATAERKRTAKPMKMDRAANGGFAGAAMRSAPAAVGMMDSLSNSVQARAAATVLSESATRYDLKEKVTVPNGGSTMVAVLSERVQGEKAHLYAPNGGVPMSYQFPFQVARLRNTTGAYLERGPISVLGGGAFLGQGLLEALPRGATAFVPFALDRTITVESARNYGEASARLVRVTRDTVTIERFSSLKTNYTVKNGGSEAAKLYIKHGRTNGSELFQPVPGTELLPQDALVPLTVKAKSTATVLVEERTPVQRVVEFLDPAAAEAITLYLENGAVDAAQKDALRKALEIRRQLVELQDKTNAASNERAELERNAYETRENIKSIGKVSKADDLRQRLVKHLAELSQRIDALTKVVVTNQADLAALRARLSEALRDISVEAPQPAGPGGQPPTSAGSAPLQNPVQRPARGR